MTRQIRQLRLLGIGCFLVAILIANLAYADTESKAQNAAIGDVASSVVAIAAGGVEANPLGLLILPLKYGMLEYAKTLPDGEREYAQGWLSAIWGGATASNLCTIGVLLTGGATAIPCLIVGIGYGLYDWQSTANERQFAAICADEKVTNQKLVCNYTAPT